jgi:GNAT superfamily N-acetyltransferase
MAHTFQHGDYELSTDKERLDLDRVESFLRASYWAPERPRETIERSIDGSLVCLGSYRRNDGVQVGFCRVVSDGATFGWVCDVFVDEAHRGRKLGEAMVEMLVGLPQLRGVRLVLATRDAHGGCMRSMASRRWLRSRGG